MTTHGTAAGDVAVLCGGVGAARFLQAARHVVDPQRLTAIVNTGDDTELHGLSISPDLDTVTYTVAGAIDPERGWGLVDETWRAVESLERYAAVRPAGSSAAPSWFRLGDRDLATHFYRTARLGEGASLTEVTDEVRRAWEVPIRVVPMSDDRVRTVVTVTATLDESGEPTPCEPTDLPFQEYFVRHRHAVPVVAIRFDGAATLGAAAREALATAGTVVVAPSNPLVSIGPIRSLPGVDDLLGARRERVVAISPIVGGAALKGPADRMLTELGHRADVVGVARLYAPIASALVVDRADADHAQAVEAEGVRCVVTDTVMADPEIARRLVATTLDTVAG